MNANGFLILNRDCYQIIDGPSVDTLLDAFKYAYSGVKIPVNFKIPRSMEEGKFRVPLSIRNMRITSIEHEDGSGNSFNLHGYCEIDLGSGNYSRYPFMAYYNSKTRAGTVAFVKE